MKTKQLISAVIALFAIILVSPAVAQAQTAASVIITEEGFDFLKLGANYKSIPAKVDGLYDNVTVEKDGVNIDTGAWDGTYRISFGWKREPNASYISATTDKDGNVVSIWVGGNKRFKAKVGNQLIQGGSKYSALSKLPGAKVYKEAPDSYTTIGKFVFVEELDWEIGFTDKISEIKLSK